jgi:hypothetical protein
MQSRTRTERLGHVCRLGFWKEPRALHWVPTPPASCYVRVHGVLSAAASSGIACLHLASMLPVRSRPNLWMKALYSVA